MARKIRNTALEKITEAQATAAAIKALTAEARMKEIEATKIYDRKITDLRIKIATGDHTTGDHLLDLNIVVNRSVLEDEQYMAMTRFEESIASHAGELVAQTSGLMHTPHIDSMGILSEDPRLQLQVGAAFGRGKVFGGDPSVRVVLPVFGLTGNGTGLLYPQGVGDDFGRNIIFEDKLQWILENEPNLHLAINLWSDALLLDWPLDPPKRVANEIIVRREKIAVQLQGLSNKLFEETRDLEQAQKNPQSWTKAQTEVNGEKVVVSFPDNVSRIKRAYKYLVQGVNEARRLGMGIDPVSPAYNNAQSVLEANKRWAD